MLDIGCNGGFYSIQMKQRGAERVLGIDVDDRYLNQARFAAETLDLDIEFEKRSVYDVDDDRGQFDYVFFMGVFYHLRYPLFALDKVIKKVTKTPGFPDHDSGFAGSARKLRADYSVLEQGDFSRAGFSRDVFHRKKLFERLHELVDSESGCGGGHVAQLRAGIARLIQKRRPGSVLRAT